MNLDTKFNRRLLISRYGIDCQRYNAEYSYITWEACSLRRWMNETFLKEAFSSDEQNRILTSKVCTYNASKPSVNIEKDTKDKVFLLSIEEVEKYFPSEDARKCAPTIYARARNAWITGENCWWRLRSPSHQQSNAINIFSSETINYLSSNVNLDGPCVRPAFRTKQK